MAKRTLNVSLKASKISSTLNPLMNKSNSFSFSLSLPHKKLNDARYVFIERKSCNDKSFDHE